MKIARCIAMEHQFVSTLLMHLSVLMCYLSVKILTNHVTKFSEWGAETLLDFCLKRSVTCLYHYLLSQPSCVYVQFVHDSCRKRFTDPCTIYRCAVQ